MGHNSYRQYIVSEEWAQVKIDLIQIRGCKCENCGKPRTPAGLDVHHLTYERLFEENPEDLILLCGGCHMQQHPDKIPEQVLMKMQRIAIYREKKERERNKYKDLAVFTYKPETKKNKTDFANKVNEMKDKLISAGHKIISERRLTNGYQYKISCGTNMNIFHTCTIVVQGVNAHLLRELIK